MGRVSTLLIVIFGTVCSGARLKLPIQNKFHGHGPAVNAKMGLETSGCSAVEKNSLSKILGAAYNPRYMSLVLPADVADEEDGSTDVKRGADAFRPFSVDEGFSADIGEDTPAWDLDHTKSDQFTNGRFKRSGNTTRAKRSHSTPWECKSIVKWLDMGNDYFPRYVRNVECSRDRCWYDKYQCRPKSFTVKILRRKHGKCAQAKTGVAGLPSELRELWVWEERAVNFCCECAPD